MTDFAQLLPLALLGAILGLDVVSFPQAMISRPLVAATAAGLLLGDPVRGLLIGATLEMFALETLPFGASRYPEWGSAAVVGGGLFAFHDTTSAGALTVAVLAALVCAWVGGWSMVQLRKLNAQLARTRHEAVAAGSKRVVEGLQVFGLTADVIRGGLLTAVALAVFTPVQAYVLGTWSTDPRVSRAVVVAIAASVAAGAVWKVVHAAPGARWLLLGGVAVGLALVAMR
ncbi:MAG TPA: PTS sugar transporter subunit IIC [Gemmatimonadaceae bacterium]|nr:PTS sugar transporter subunit IIC [Gemmatimonadaceae bacterium]